MQNDARRGIALMIATTFIFALQDGISRHLGENYPVLMIVMLRYWFLAAFVVTIASRRAGGIRKAARSAHPFLQVLRGVLLAAEIVITVYAFVLLGLVETHAIFACYPLIVAALSGPLLGEAVGWRRWAAIGVGLVGVLVILQPGVRVFSPAAIIPLVGAFGFALYALLTRYVSRADSAATSFFWTGVGGAAAITLIGPFYWTPMTPGDAVWMGVLCLTGAVGHALLIRAYEAAEASVVQPFAFFQLVFVSFIGVGVFGEVLEPTTVIGAAIVVGAALFTLWRERVKAAR